MISMRLTTWWGSQAVMWPRAMWPQAEALFGLGRFACVATLFAIAFVFVVEANTSSPSPAWLLPFGLIALASLPALVALLSSLRLLGNPELPRQDAPPPQVVISYFAFFPATAFALALQTLYRVS